MRDKFAQAIALLKKGFQGLTGDVSVAAGSTTATIPNDTVTFAKMQNVTGPVLIGRETASAGDLTTVAIGSGLTYSGGTLSASGGAYNWKEYCRIQFYPNLYNIYSSITYAGYGSKFPTASTTKWEANWLFSNLLTSNSTYGLNYPRFCRASHALGGFRCITLVAHELVWTQNAAFFYGMGSTYPTSPANTANDQLLNMTGLNGIGIGAETGKANYQLAHSDGGGTVTVVDTGVTIEADDLGILTISADASGTDIDLSFELIGRSTYTVTVSSNIPSASTLLIPLGGIRSVTGLEAGSSGIMFIDCYIP